MVDVPTCAGIAQLVPPQTGPVRAVHIDGMVENQRLIGAEVAVLQAIHQTVGDRIQPASCALLLDTVTASAAHVCIECGGGQDLGLGKGRRGRIGPINVEIPQLELVGRIAIGVVVHLGKDVGRAGSRRRAVEISWKHAAQIRIYTIKIEIHHLSWQPLQHFVTLERNRTSPAPGIACKLVDGHVVAVGPDAKVGIIVEFGRADLELIAIPGTRWITRL